MIATGPQALPPGGDASPAPSLGRKRRAAIDGKILKRDMAREIGREKYDCVCDLLQRGDLSERNAQFK